MVSPFDSVPNELILMIFRHAIKTYHYTTDTAFAVEQSDIDTILSVSGVCGRWRDICLSDGGLWASAIEVDYSDLSLVRIFAEYANKSPLVIHSSCLYYPCQTAVFETPNWEFVLAHVATWGTFSLQGDFRADEMEPLLQALTHHAPNLELFQINNLERPCMEVIIDNDDLDDHLMVLPDNLFASDAPRLKKFSITNVYLRRSFDFSVWMQLTDLFVDQYLGGLQGNKISSRQWVDILREIKQLEVLVLAWSYDTEFEGFSGLFEADLDPDRSIEAVPDVRLDHLRKVALVAASERNIMFDIFPKLVIPHACTTSIIVGHHFEEAIPFDWLAVGLDRRVMGWSAAKIPYRIALLRGFSEFGFRIDLNPGTVDSDFQTTIPGNYDFQFRYTDYHPHIRPPLPFSSTPRFKMMNVLRKYKNAEDWSTFDMKSLSPDFSAIADAFT